MSLCVCFFAGLLTQVTRLLNVLVQVLTKTSMTQHGRLWHERWCPLTHAFKECISSVFISKFEKALIKHMKRKNKLLLEVACLVFGCPWGEQRVETPVTIIKSVCVENEWAARLG